MKPAARSHTIRLVLDLAWVEHVKLFEDRGFEQLRVECGHTIDSVGADDRQEGHANPLLVALLDQAHPANFLVVIRVPLSHSLQEVVVDFVD